MAPVSSFFGLETALRGLLAQQRLLDTTGHNIANASTPGYSRQQAILQASPALEIAGGGTASGAPASLGSGVDVQSFRRVRDAFTDIQYRTQNSLLGNAAAQADALDQAEAALAEPGENGINAQLSEFWDAWSDLANANDGNALAAKQAVVEAAQGLGDTFAAVRSQFQTVADQAQAQYDDLTRSANLPNDPGGEIAQTAQEVADLNKVIKRAVSVGDSPNDLMDRRDQLLDQLSGYGQISVTDNGDGSVDVSFADSQSTPLVTGETSAWTGPPASWSATSNAGGKLGGLLAVSQTLSGYVQSLDGVAGQVQQLVNGAYGGDFFVPGADASSLDVDPTLLTAPSGVVIGSGGAGSNDIATAVSQLRGRGEIDGAYQAFVAKVGSEVRAADRTKANSQALVDNVADRRQSVSGVSLDEEMTNLIQFQRGYQASARAMSTMDDLLDVLINRTGRVGL